MPDRRSIDWAGVRMAYVERLETIEQIAVRFGTSPSTIYRRAKDGNWLGQVPERVRPPDDRSHLLQRLYRAIDRKLAQLEARMDSDDELTVSDHERETRAIGQLIRNVEKIAGLEDTSTGSRTKRGGRSATSELENGEADAEQIRRELAERILRFREIKRGDR